MSTVLLKPLEILRRANAVGTYHGFRSFSDIALENRGKGARGPYPESLKLEELDPQAREVA